MIVASLEPITLQNIEAFKVARLRALLDSPWAFGSTYAKESMMSDVEWVQRVMRWDGTLGVGFLALEQQVVCGIAGGLLDENDQEGATRFHVDGARISQVGGRSNAGRSGYWLGAQSRRGEAQPDGY
jgi:hypothetical protein